LCHELGNGAGRVVLALVPGVAQFDENGFVDRAANVAVGAVVKFEGGEFGGDLPDAGSRIRFSVQAVPNVTRRSGAGGGDKSSLAMRLAASKPDPASCGRRPCWAR